MKRTTRFTKAELLEAYRDVPEEKFSEIKRLLDERRPRKVEAILGDSLESVCWPEQAYNNCETPKWEIEYFNPGDPYTPCIMRLNRRGNVGLWRIECTGVYIERHFKDTIQ